MPVNIGRRELIAALAGTAAWPLDTLAQQPERMLRIGVLINRAADNPDGQARLAAFQKALQQLGWNDGRNARIDIRWGGTDVERERRYVLNVIAGHICYWRLRGSANCHPAS
jgi:putative tryptophan/tyrosine transport system substrate-binding protein